MSLIRILNMRTNRPHSNYPWQVRVDRRSVLGNPFYMANESQRDGVCDKYEKWLSEAVMNDPKVGSEIIRLSEVHKKYGKLELYCWCAPRRCHAEAIKNLLERG